MNGCDIIMPRSMKNTFREAYWYTNESILETFIYQIQLLLDQSTHNFQNPMVEILKGGNLEEGWLPHHLLLDR